MGEHQAFIFYDHGIRNEINDFEYENAFKIRAAIKNPNDSGMPTNDEFEDISNMEDRLTEELEKKDCVMVGRVTVDCYRYFTFYTNTDESELNNIVESIATETDYKLGSSYKSDPEKSEYWDSLFPTKADMQVIQDMKVLDALQDAGDTLTVARQINHWAYFERENDMQTFSDWLKSEGYEIVSQNPPDDEVSEYSIQFSNIATPNLREITSITIRLQAKAEEMSGEYDGWETSIEVDNSE